MQTDSSSGFPRDWNLEGSQNSKEWFILRRHIADESMSEPGRHYAWPVYGAYGGVGFRYLRVVMTGQSSKQDQKFSLAGIELYGYFK